MSFVSVSKTYRTLIFSAGGSSIWEKRRARWVAQMTNERRKTEDNIQLNKHLNLNKSLMVVFSIVTVHFRTLFDDMYSTFCANP